MIDPHGPAPIIEGMADETHLEDCTCVPIYQCQGGNYIIHDSLDYLNTKYVPIFKVN